jgi:AraC-like DNA-binding protein
MYNPIISGIANIYRSAASSHRHQFWEMVYYIDCSGFAYIEDKKFEFHDGSIFILPPGMSHYETSQGEMTIAYLGIEKLYTLEHRLYCLKDNTDGDFLNILRQLYKLHQLKPYNWERIGDALVNALEQYILSWSGPRRKNAVVESFEHLLVSNIHNNVCMDELIRQVPVSSSHFRKLFKAETRKSPVEYLLDLKIGSAMQLLSNTSMAVKDIAFTLGFSDVYYFSRLFKKKTGKYPSQWRQPQ